MQYKFLNIFLEKKDILSPKNDVINPYLLENNASQLEKIYDFYNSETPVLALNGFIGTGKVQVINYSLGYLSEETIVLKYNCFESTILDDVLLSFFNDFKKLQSQKIINEPKIKSENFTQKINSYFTSIEKPFVIIIDSFESVIKENRQEILDFIFHLATLQKIKVVLISRAFESEYFAGGTPYERVQTLAFEKHIFEKFLKSKKLKFNNTLLDEFYKQTRGYYFYTALSIKIMENKGLSLSEFLTALKASFLSFYDFLEKESLELIPATSRNLFWLLSLLRHGVTVELLKTLNLYNEKELNAMTENLILTSENSIIYVHDYFKEQVTLNIAPNIAQKLHQYIVDLYNTQLPLKPSERNISISRQTMRSEIEYNNLFLPKKPKNIENKDIDINYLAYAKGLDFDLTYLNKPKEEEEEVKKEVPKPQAPVQQGPITGEIKPIQIDVKDLPFKLSPEEMAMLDNTDVAQNLKNIPLTQVEIHQEPEITMTFTELLEQAKREETHYNYKNMIELCQKALEFENDKDYYIHLPVIYTKLALAYQKITDWDNALKYYDSAKEFYEQTNEENKANYIKLNIANIFYETYKLEKSKNILLEIINSKNNPAILTTKAYIALANLEDSLSHITNAYNYFKKAVDNSNDTMDTETLSELYFKYALISDDKNNAEQAIEFYEKCINLDDDPKVNKFLSSAYSNLATLYLEKNNNAMAVKNYLKAFDIDEKNNNFDGMYFSASKLAQVLQKKYPEKSLEYFHKAFEYAQILSDIFYMASASLAIGDFYYNRKQDDIALKQYIYALDLVKNEFSKDNIDKIKMRINDIKFRLGEEKFKILEKEIYDGKI